MVLTMDSPWLFTAFRAPAEPDAAPEALREIQRLRARILFDEGRRPAFRSDAGDNADEQPQDDVRVLIDPAGHPFCLFVNGA